MLRCIRLAACALVLSPLGAMAFEAVDVLTPTTTGHYPAYPSEALPLRNYWVQLGAMYDSNLLRRPSGDNEDTIVRLGAGARGEYNVIGRQRFYYEARVDGYKYHQFENIDNVAWGALGEWRYEIGNDLSGVLGASLRQFQAALSEIQRDTRDEVTERRVVGTAAYRVGPHLRLRGGLEYLSYDRPALAQNNIDNLIGLVGADWVTDLGNTFGVEAHDAKGEAPVNQLVDPLGIFVNNNYRQRDIMVTGAWVSSPFVRFAGRYGRTQRSYDVLPGRDYTGPTWLAALEFLPGNKTIISFETSRHISSLIEVGASHAVITGYSFGPSWAATAKMNLIARLFQQKIDYSGDPAAELGVTPVRSETLRGVRVGTYWEYNRNIHWQFAVDHGTRSSNFEDRDFKYNAFMGNVRYVFW
jgi:hypothetical protein